MADKVGPFSYPKIFQCNSGSELKAVATKMLEKHELMIKCTMTRYTHTHTAFFEALDVFAEQLFKVQDAQELNDPKKYYRFGLRICMDW